MGSGGSPVADFFVDYDPDGVFGDVIYHPRLAVVDFEGKTFLNGTVWKFISTLVDQSEDRALV